MSSNKKKLEGHIINTIDHSLAIELYVDRQLGRKAVAERLGVSEGIVWRILCAYGIPLRSAAEAQKVRWDRKHTSEIEALKARLTYLYWDQQKTADECGAVLGMTGAAVIYWMTKLCIKRRKRSQNGKWETLDADMIVRLYVDENHSCPEIARRFGVSSPLIAKVLEHRGIRRRTGSEAANLCHQKRYRKQVKKESKSCFAAEGGGKIKIEREAGLPPVEVNRKMSVRELRDAELTINQIAEITGKSPVDVYQELQ